MKRYLPIACASLLVGIIMSEFILSIPIAIIIFSILILTLVIIRKHHIELFKVSIYCTICIIMGFIHMSLNSYIIYEKYSEYNNQEVTIHGRIDSIKKSNDKYKIKLNAYIVSNVQEFSKGNILINIISDYFPYKYGDYIRTTTILEKPKGRRNPGGFNYKKYLAGQRISAICKTDINNLILINSEKQRFEIKSTILKMGINIRDKIIFIINENLPKEQGALLTGMLLGYGDLMSEDMNVAFRRAGLSHIIVASGANVAFILFPIIFILKKLRIQLLLRNMLGIISVLIYVTITGFDPSITRAAIMGIFILVAELLRRETDFYTSIALSAIILIVINPFVIYNIGFQLSYSATISIVLFYKPIYSILPLTIRRNKPIENKSKVKDGTKDRIPTYSVTKLVNGTIATTLAAQMGVLPILTYYFNTISVISIIANLVVVPLTGIITVLGLAMTFIGFVLKPIAQILGNICNTLLTFILYITKITSGFKLASIDVVSPHMIVILLYYIIIAFFIVFYKELKKTVLYIKESAIIIVICTIMIFSVLYSIIPQQMKVVFLDVGQGDCAFIETSRNKKVIIDGGGSIFDDEECYLGEKVVVPFLKKSGSMEIDVIIATHGHADHINGLISIMNSCQVERLILPNIRELYQFDKLIHIAKIQNIPIEYVESGKVLYLDNNTRIEFVYPSNDINDLPRNNPNNTSLVLKLIFKHTEILFTGDIEKEAEEIITRLDYNIDADIIKVPHHGSDTSSSSYFIEKVNPKISIMSVGDNNFGHPSDEIIENYLKKNVRIYRTDNDGAVIVKSNGSKIKVWSMGTNMR